MTPRRLAPLDPREYAWDTARMVERPCPFCGPAAAEHGSPHALRPDGLTVHACAACGTYWVSPAPDAAQLAALYERYHEKVRVAAFAGTKWHARSTLPSTADPEALEAHLRGRAPLADERVARLASLARLEGARVLDVGCGTGALALALARLGASVVGIDVDSIAVGFARDRLGLDARRGTLSDVSDTGPFDLVCLQDVLEHVLDPRDALERAVALARPGGLLYVWTPNAGAIASEREPKVLRADFEHLQFLQPRTLDVLAGELDLELVHAETLGRLDAPEDGLSTGIRRALRRVLERVPGFHAANRARVGLGDRLRPPPAGYHLFGVLRKRA